MIDLFQYKCPNCNKYFSYLTNYFTNKTKIKLDKTYQYEMVNFFCNNCKKSINGIQLEQLVLWNEDYEFYYDKFVTNKNNRIVEGKQFLYLFFPYNDQKTIKSILNFIKLEKFDAIIIPEYFKKYIAWEKQLCILPTSMFEYNYKKIYPNYLAQKIIINQANIFLNSKIYSIYNTFFYKFNILYGIKDWKKLKLMIND